MFSDPRSPTTPAQRAGWHLLLTPSLAAIALCLAARDAWAVCPPVPVVSSTFDTVRGDTCAGGLSAGAGGTINANAVTVLVTDTPPSAVQATSGGTINFIGGASTISTNATAGRALLADGPTSVITGPARPTITATNGINAESGGVVALNGGRITFQDGFEVVASGSNSSGVVASGTDSFVDATNGSEITVTASCSRYGGRSDAQWWSCRARC